MKREFATMQSALLEIDRLEGQVQELELRLKRIKDSGVVPQHLPVTRWIDVEDRELCVDDTFTPLSPQDRAALDRAFQSALKKVCRDKGPAK